MHKTSVIKYAKEPLVKEIMTDLYNYKKDQFKVFT